MSRFRPLQNNPLVFLSNSMPQENFLTNCFSLLLASDPTLLQRFLRLVLSKREMEVSSLPGTNYTVETQCVSNFGVIDIRIAFDSGSELFVENKLRAPFFASQVRRYLKSKARVALISLTEPNIPNDLRENDRFYWVTWTEVKSLLRSPNRRAKAYDSMFREMFLSYFLDYLSEMGIMSFEGFRNQEYGGAWERYSEFLTGADFVFDRIKKQMKGYNPHGYDDESKEIGYYFWLKRCKRRCCYYFGFRKIQGRVYFVAGLWLQKLFRQFVRDKYYLETEEIGKQLIKRDFMLTWDKDLVEKQSMLVQLLKKTHSKDKQITSILALARDSVKTLDTTGLISLMEKAAAEYGR